MSKTLVACFSATGTTARLGRRLAALAGADFYEIRPAKPYTPADLDWMNSGSRSSVEMNDPDERPALADWDARVEHCDTILLGFPIWWYTAPRIVQTFLERYSFSGKRVILFATSGGSGFGQTAELLRQSAPGARLEEGQVLCSNVSEAQLRGWLTSL